MKKLLIWLTALFMSFLIIVIVAAVIAINYMKPDVERDLAFKPIPLEKRALDMARNLTLDLTLTSDDVNQLAKKALAANPDIGEDIRITGADFTLAGNRLTADLNVLWKKQIRAQLRVVYALKWEEPNIVAVPLSAKLKDFGLPMSLLSERVIPIAGELPKLLKIKEIEWGRNDLNVVFRKPTLSELRELAG